MKAENRIQQIGRAQQDPAAAAARNELIQLIRHWVAELPPLQRAAVSRIFDPLSDYDSAVAIPNEYVNRCRGLQRLRRRALAAG
jgi:hypothetical protein